jgi:uncharacterized protein
MPRLRRSVFPLALASALSLALSGPAAAQRLPWIPNPAVTGGWVSDAAGHLSPGTVDSLQALMTALERRTSIEMAVVVADSLGGMPAGDAALLLHRQWGVGKAERDNGIVLLWSPALQQLHVSVGYGLEGVLPDARAGRIQDQEIVPAFQRGDFDAGILAGATALALAAGEETQWRDSALGVTRGATRPVEPERDQGGGGLAAVLAAVLASLLLAAGGAGAVSWRRYRPRPCPNGHGPMRRLDEQGDDARLRAGQIMEETLGSVDYDVWVCDQCDAQLVVPYRRWLTRYSTCPQCDHHTLETTRRTIVAATQLAGGEDEVTRQCRYCGYSDVRRRSTPRLGAVASAGGSPGGRSGGGGGGGRSGGFGGGSAGGGGAGRSY